MLSHGRDHLLDGCGKWRINVRARIRRDDDCSVQWNSPDNILPCHDRWMRPGRHVIPGAHAANDEESENAQSPPRSPWRRSDDCPLFRVIVYCHYSFLPSTPSADQTLRNGLDELTYKTGWPSDVFLCWI